MHKYIWIKSKKYYLYEHFDSYHEAIKTAKYYKKKNKSRYFIIKTEKGWVFPENTYALYLTKIMRIW